ncbi:hypothetical protein ACFX2I_005181 [Malus domestica]|uniref:Transmembrane protein n=1 Tax=Malus domestica TaxID=3750 RepID=A0A498IRK1_MALDO|nr:uncharacterized protein LOC103412517 isoform X1 [Malus domestica]XP_028966295.1 uncharacterized protein LOC103412517 isoform X1 [Malus domestica]RXH85976.1 hypothetical protein DVH24_017029 [Malus domestica]
MAENPKLDSDSGEVYGLEERMGTQKISVSDHINGFHYTADKSDSFVIDMESFSHGGTDKDATANSRVSMQRNLSRKWSQRGGEKKIICKGVSNDKEVSSTTSSPVATIVGSSTPEKSPLAVGTIDQSSNPHVHHQITVTAANISTTTEGRCVVRRNSFRRSSSWGIDPKRVLLFFATMSSVGTILLIYFTLSIAKYNADENSLDWQQ